MANKHSVTVILNLWRRNHFSEQVEALFFQSVKPTKILILQNENFHNHVQKYNEIKKWGIAVYWLHSDCNLKYFARFSLGCLVDSEFTWVLDDDVIPGQFWLERCIEEGSKSENIISGIGRILPPFDFQPELCKSLEFEKYFIGDCYKQYNHSFCERDTVVDFACSSYFFRTSCIRYFWKLWPYSFESGEDIHLSASSKILGKVGTKVLAQITPSESANINIKYGFDENASWRKPDFIDKREKILRYLVMQKGWRPLLFKTESPQ